MINAPATFNDTLSALRDTLVQISRWGCRGFECSPQSLAILERWTQPMDAGPAKDSLEAIRHDLGQCTRCALSAKRTHVVFGEGNPKADLMFVGEGPGYEEDHSARPFVGPAGQLLTRIIEAMHLTRDQVYICNRSEEPLPPRPCLTPINRCPSSEAASTTMPVLK